MHAALGGVLALVRYACSQAPEVTELIETYA